jgi:hypothetical protein
LEEGLVNFFKNLAEELHRNNLKFILVEPPSRPGTAALFGADDFERLRSFVDHFSLMTYDYSVSAYVPFDLEMS